MRHHLACLALLAAALGAAEPSAPDRGAPDPQGSGGEADYAPPASSRLRLNLDPDWRFLKADAAGAEKPDFDDKAWSAVSLPHTWNDTDTFREWRSHANKGGNAKVDTYKEKFYEGKAWYRKHLALDAAWAGRKVFLEFEMVRNTGVFWVNGTKVGMHSDQVGPCGLDITAQARFGGDNVIAVQVDSNMLAKDPAGFSYGWSAAAFYPTFGGLVADVSLHLADPLHQTLPLYSNLGTSGVYVHPERIDTLRRTAEVAVDAEVANERPQACSAVFSAWVIDRDGKEVARAAAPAQSIAAGAKATLSANLPLTGIHCWEPDYPYLYRVYSALSVDGTLVDVVRNPLGIRVASFSASEGLKLNGHPIYLKGYAPRTTMEWAVAGIPQDWMIDYDYVLMKANHANFIRPMHVAPRRNQVDAADRLGIILACPAGNGEGDDPPSAEGKARWQDRLALMRDVTIYFRNDPSVLFYEASNSGISAEHMRDMDAVRRQWDPHGGRFSGCRGTDEKTENLKGYESQMDGIFRTTAIPAWDAEYARAEAPRRVWDKYTPVLDQGGKPVLGGYLKIASPVHVQATAAGTGDGIYEYPQDAFRVNSSEDLALNNLLKYWDRYKLSAFVEAPAERTAKGVTVGGAKIIFADSNSHGRMMDMEVARVSGALDAVRLPKEAYFALQVAHNPDPQVHILGHWNYPAGTVKPVWVACNADKVRLATYDEAGKLLKDYGWGVRDVANAKADRVNQYAFRFADVAWAPGRVEAVAFDGEREVARQAKATAGPAAALRLTPVTGPGAWRADGADIALVDVEVVDAQGRRCPTDEGRVDFAASGAGTFLGGYDSGIQASTYRPYLDTEAGINRVLVRATREAGTFTLTATRAGLKPASASLASVAFPAAGGLTAVWPRRYGWRLGSEPAAAASGAAAGPAAAVATASKASTSDVMREFAYTGTNGASLTPPQPLAHIEHGLKDGARIYVDREWTFAGLPAYLRGGDWVQAFERDASETTSTDTIQFYSNRRCRIYLLVDAANAMPNHNNNADYGWQRLPETVAIGGRPHAVWRSRELPEGHNGYFASNGFGIALAPGSNQYVAVAVASP